MKEKILVKATDMFLNLGFKSVTMDDIANEMGISKKTIYAHYENKTHLVEESTSNLFLVISSGINDIIAVQKNPIEELYEIKKFVMLHLKDEKSSPQYQLQKYYPKIYDDLREKEYDLMFDSVVENIKRGLELGIYRSNIDVDFVSRIYYSGAFAIKDHKIFPSSKFKAADLEDYFLEYHLRGIVTPKGRQILNGIINSNQE
ncbi:TetR/AcrR family transcriptional regulator [Maribacter sp. 2-571]|uniref:TetR/AcrR family transcriptional regulator n=1 Tax=Maribacter sp. 2-571 TaxID=3417569 RepID=UPI003D32C04C